MNFKVDDLVRVNLDASTWVDKECKKYWRNKIVKIINIDGRFIDVNYPSYSFPDRLTSTITKEFLFPVPAQLMLFEI